MPAKAHTFRISTHKQAVRQQLAALSKRRTIDAEDLHRLRIALRRMQAWLELVGDTGSAETLGEQMSALSPLRALHVLEQWLVRRRAYASDLRKVRRSSRSIAKRLLANRTMTTIRQTLGAMDWAGGLGGDTASKTWRIHRKRLRHLLRLIREDPTRKRLHRLRLAIKTIRYQMEWLNLRGTRGRRTAEALRSAQRCLGQYEDLASFRDLAKRLELRSRRRIRKHLRRARREARRLANDLDWLMAWMTRAGRDGVTARIRP